MKNKEVLIEELKVTGESQVSELINEVAEETYTEEIVEQPIEEKEFACPLDYRKTEQEDIQNMLMALLN